MMFIFQSNHCVCWNFAHWEVVGDCEMMENRERSRHREHSLSGSTLCYLTVSMGKQLSYCNLFPWSILSRMVVKTLSLFPKNLMHWGGAVRSPKVLCSLGWACSGPSAPSPGANAHPWGFHVLSVEDTPQFANTFLLLMSREIFLQQFKDDRVALDRLTIIGIHFRIHVYIYI